MRFFQQSLLVRKSNPLFPFSGMNISAMVNGSGDGGFSVSWFLRTKLTVACNELNIEKSTSNAFHCQKRTFYETVRLMNTFQAVGCQIHNRERACVSACFAAHEESEGCWGEYLDATVSSRGV